jgi:predicted Zn-dependent peptidase
MISHRRLKNGVRVVTERIPHVRSCSIGIWLQLGSRYETAQNAGLNHFIEHMLFKGTRQLNAQQIADHLHYLGGNINAYTTQEYICLHARVVDEKVPQAIEILAELVQESIFPEDEIRRERSVVLEECKMYEDSPDDLCIDLCIKNLWPDHPLGRPIIGCRRNIRSFSRNKLKNYWHAGYQPERLSIAIAGAFDPLAINRLLRTRFGKPARSDRRPPRSRPPSRNVNPGLSSLKRSVEQVHFCLGTVGPSRCSADRYAFSLLNMILGGGMNSRLFQEIREKRGLAYSIGSFSQFFSDTGFFVIYGGTSPGKLGQVLEISMRELNKICMEDVREEELELARTQVIDAMIMNMESTESRMTHLAESVLYFDRVIPLEESISKFGSIGTLQLREMAHKYLSGRQLAVCLVSARGVRPSRSCFKVADV